MKNLEELKKLLKETHDELYKKYADYINDEGDLYVWQGKIFSPFKLSIGEKDIAVYGGHFTHLQHSTYLHYIINDDNDREDVVIASMDINANYVKDWLKWAKQVIENIKADVFVEKEH
jgi:hypothetical protein